MSDHLSDFLAQFLRRTDSAHVPSSEAPETHARAVAAMEAALRASQRERLLRRSALVATGATLGVALFLWLGFNRGGTVKSDFIAQRAVHVHFEQREHGGDAVTGAVPPGWNWQPGAVVQTEGRGDAAFKFKDGTTVALGSGTRARFRRSGGSRRFELQQGRLDLKVQPLRETAKFEVLTDEVAVVVHGTAFTVEKLRESPCPDRPATRVNVAEGRVEVSHQGERTYVSAGESWPAPCPVMSSSLLTDEEERPAPTPARPAARPAAPPASSGSALEAQNGLFARSVSLEKSGDLDGAIEALERLLSKYPKGPLTESAEVARLKLLERSNRLRARDAAQSYLERYPRGFGREEAIRILDGKKGSR